MAFLGLPIPDPIKIVVVVIFGHPHLLGTPERWSAALLLLLVTSTDLFGGYVFNIALSKRIFDVGGAPMA